MIWWQLCWEDALAVVSVSAGCSSRNDWLWQRQLLEMLVSVVVAVAVFTVD